MTSPTSSIGNALFTKTQQRVLGLLYGQPEQSYYMNEVVRLAGIGKGTIGRELSKLVEAGLLTSTRRGNQTHFQANPDAPIFNELKSIVIKTFGTTDIIKQAIGSLLPQLEKAFIYGSLAKGEEHSDSDIDLMLVGDSLIYSEVMELLEVAEQQLGRSINPTLLTAAEFKQRVDKGQSFITRVMEQPKIWLV